MKRIGKFLVFLVISLIGINHVFAIDEYGLIINSSGSIIVRNAKTNSNISTFDGLYSFSNDVLTLNENYYYAYIDTDRTITITSNDKKVYANFIKSRKSLIINDLDYESYLTEIPSNMIRYHLSSDSSVKWYTILESQDDLTITSSKVYMHYDRPNYINNELQSYTGSLRVTDSIIRVSDILVSNRENAEGSIFIEDSSILFNEEVGPEILSYNEISINNSIVEHLSRFASTILTINNSLINDNSHQNIEPYESQVNSINIKDSKLYLNTCVAANDLTIDNSFLEIIQKHSDYLLEIVGYDYTTMSPLIVVNHLTLKNNSNINIISEGTVPAVVLLNPYEIDNENILFINNDRQILNLKKALPEEAGFYSNPNNYQYQFNNSYLGGLNEIGFYTLVDNDGKAVMNFENVEGVRYTFKVKNGTWEDGSDEDITKVFLPEYIPSIDDFVTISNEDDKKLIFTKTGDNEYTYEYVDKIKEEISNPKTGVNSLVFLLVLSIILFVGLFLRRKELSLFKNL